MNRPRLEDLRRSPAAMGGRSGEEGTPGKPGRLKVSSTHEAPPLGFADWVLLAGEKLGGAVHPVTSPGGPETTDFLYDICHCTSRDLFVLPSPGSQKFSPFLKTQQESFTLPESLLATPGLIDLLIWALLALSICATI